MPIARKFLDWTRPALVSAAEFLVSRHTAGGEVNLAGLVVVLPGARAGRRMLEVLVGICEARGLGLMPPTFTTAGGLPELLYRPKKRFATGLEQQLAWVRAIQGHDRKDLAKVVRQLPAESDVLAWLDVAGLLHRLHRELATDVLNFSDVVRLGKDVEGFAEEERWQILAEIQDRYLRTLDSLDLWDMQTARIEALKRKECATEQEIVLVGTVDLNEAVRKMLDQVEEQTPGRLTALVFAPLDMIDRFDSHGCVVAEIWQDVAIEIPEDCIATADDAAEQAELVVRTIADYNGRYRADEITVGVADELLAPQVERLLAQGKVPARWGPGRPLPQTGTYRLLAAVGAYLNGGRLADFAALVRHPDLSEWLIAQGLRGDWLSELDNYHNAHFPARLGDEWLGEEDKFRALRPAQAALAALLAPLAGKMLPLCDWSIPIIALLNSIYGQRVVDREDLAQRSLLAACRKLVDSIQELGELEPALAPPVSAAEAIELALIQAASEAVPPPSDQEAIELLGWLELPLDDAPALIVTSFNDGFVPTAVNSDLFLPNALRSKLKLEDNARRYARDAYALSLLLASRADLKLIVARRDAQKNPLAPSRLLFAADGETVARRALRFFEPRTAAAPRAPLAGAWSAGRERADFPIPPPRKPEAPFTQLSVTAFKAYLACPYRFHLRHVERLFALDDAAEELDGGSFGNLMHAVFERFGKSDLRDSTDPAAIARLLQHELSECISQTFGRRPAAAIAIQAEQMRGRLAAFARHQAERANSGWRIEFTEPPDLSCPFEVDGEPFLLTGRIDRIDVHAESGRRAILDYKTSDAGRAPRKTHEQSGEWIDLQLPLYRYLAQGLGLTGPFDLGYVVLPKDTSKTGFVWADWNTADLASADERARRVIRDLRAGKYQTLTDPPPFYSEEYAPICQDEVFEKARLA